MTVSSSSDTGGSQTATLSAIFDRSRTAESIRTVRRWNEDARLFAFVSVCIRQLAEILTRWVGGSVLYMSVFGLVDRGNTTLARWIGHSRGYRWLTTEPDPEVIVIDLRETWTVGPVIAILERVIAGIHRTAADSAAVSMGSRATDRTLAAPIRMAGFVLLGIALLTAVSAVISNQRGGLLIALGIAVVGGVAVFETRSWAELRETWLVALLVATFEPPEPPDSTSSDSAPATDNDKGLKTDTGNPKEDPETSHPSTNVDVTDDEIGTEFDEH